MCLLQVGAIIGKGGEVISQLKSVIGVKIRISDRDDFVPGTRNRKVTISGAADAVQIAQVLPAHLSHRLSTCIRHSLACAECVLSLRRSWTAHSLVLFANSCRATLRSAFAAPFLILQQSDLLCGMASSCLQMIRPPASPA